MDSAISFAVNSNEIISECLKEHGKGELFRRADGLEFEERRVNARNKYLESHPETEPEYREAILNAAITPGMTREQAIAAWGLFEEDTRTVFGNVAEDEHSAYAYFTGFEVGGRHALYLKDEVVLGIRQTDELIQPHEKELDMRIAEETGLFYFYDGYDGQLRGSNVDQYRMDWDTQHLRLYVIEIVPPSSVRRIEQYIVGKGLTRKYNLALFELGFDSRSAPAEIRSRIALSIVPYPRLRGAERDEAESSTPATVRDPPILLPSSVRPPEDPALAPPDKWFDYIGEDHSQTATFPSINNQRESLPVDWMRDRLFRVEEVPLFVDYVSLYDLVEVEWRDGDIIPCFKRVVENYGYRTIRAVVNELDRVSDILQFAKMNTEKPMKYRYEEGVLALTTGKDGLNESAKEWLGYLPVTWKYTDTLTQD